MKFFIPNAPSPEQAEQFYEATKDYNEKMFGTPIKERRIFSITFRDNGREYTAEVGKAIHGQDIVMAILDTGPRYLICSALAGTTDGTALLALPNEVLAIVDFD